jgi:hypothetical protein
MGTLYLEAATVTVPQYMYFLIGDHASSTAALTRGWMHQELSYGALDKEAITSFIGICVVRHKEQTGGRPFPGNPFYLEGALLLSKLVAKRLRASANPEANKVFNAMAWYAKRFGCAALPGISNLSDTLTGRAACSVEGVDKSLAPWLDVAGAKQHLECMAELLAAKQLNDSPADNLRC